MSETPPPAPGLFRSLRNLLDTGLEIVQNRIELIAVEYQEERSRLVGMLVAAVVGLILGTVGTVILTMAIVLACPESWRFGVTAAFGVAYLAGAVIVLLRLHQRLRQAPPPFEASLTQIKKDREWLNSLH